MIYIHRNVNEYNKMLCKICKQQLTFARFEIPMATCYANISANDPQEAASSRKKLPACGRKKSSCTCISCTVHTLVEAVKVSRMFFIL